MNLTRREVGKGLLAPFVAVSYSGPTEEVEALSEYKALVKEATAKNVLVTLQEMAPTNSVNAGANSLSIGFMSAPHEATL